MEAPLHDGGENFFVEGRIEAVNHRGVNNRALFVYRDFDHDVASDAGPQIERQCRLGREHRPCRVNFWTYESSVRKRPIRRSRGSQVR